MGNADADSIYQKYGITLINPDKGTPVLERNAIMMLKIIDQVPFVNKEDLKGIIGTTFSNSTMNSLIQNEYVKTMKLSRREGGFVRGIYLDFRGYSSLEKDPPKGKGKTSLAHITAQALVARLMEKDGYEVTIEKQFAQHFVDVFGKNGNESRFIEIVISENVNGQISNLLEDIKAGAENVYFLFAQKSVWDILENKIKLLKSAEGKAHYCFLSHYCIRNVKEWIQCHTDNSQLS